MPEAIDDVLVDNLPMTEDQELLLKNLEEQLSEQELSIPEIEANLAAKKKEFQEVNKKRSD